MLSTRDGLLTAVISRVPCSPPSITHPAFLSLKILKRKLYDLLLSGDQLTNEKSKGNVFKDFEEAPIHFNPTYKYDIGTDNYDSSEKQRVPSWTDRILWKSRTPESVQCLEYNSVPALKGSDHRYAGQQEEEAE